MRSAGWRCGGPIGATGIGVPETHSGRWVLHFQHMFMLRAELLCFPPLAVLSV